MADTLCPVCRWWYDDDDGHKCPGSEMQQAARALADRDRRIEALTKALRMLVSLGPRAKHDLRAGVNHCAVCNAWDEAAEALASAAGAEGEA